MSGWPARVFKLAPPGDAFGISCDASGISVGPIPLLKRTGTSWRLRPLKAINADLSLRFGVPVDLASKIGGINTIVDALNDNDMVKAKIAAVQLGLPDIPVTPIRKRNGDELVGLVFRLLETGILSKTWNPTKHPRWPAGQSDGGQFRSSDADSADQPSPPKVTEEVAADPAKFTECNDRCSKLLERYRTYSWSNVNEFHYRQCMNECLGIG